MPDQVGHDILGRSGMTVIADLIGNLFATLAALCAGFTKGTGAFYKQLVCQDSTGGQNVKYDAGCREHCRKLENVNAADVEEIYGNPNLKCQGYYGCQHGSPHLEHPMGYYREG